MNAIDLTVVANVKRWMGAAVSPSWTPGLSYLVGQFIVDAALHTQRVITPGTAGGTTPTFNDGGGVTSEGPSSPQLQWQDEGFADDQTIQDCITAFSLAVLRMTGRGNADGSIPSTSPLVTPVAYNERYDGNGQRKLYVHNWPIAPSPAPVVIIGVTTIPQSTSMSTPGWVIDQDGRAFVLRGGANPYHQVFGGGRARMERGGYRFALGEQNINLQYSGGFSGVPYDLEMTARKVVALNFKRTGWIGQRSQAMAEGGGTVSYGTWEMDPDCERTLLYYRRFNF
jgi:hypothetical protein